MKTIADIPFIQDIGEPAPGYFFRPPSDRELIISTGAKFLLIDAFTKPFCPARAMLVSWPHRSSACISYPGAEFVFS